MRQCAAFTLVFAVVVVADGSDTPAAKSDRPNKSREHTVPEETGDGWETATLTSVGLDAGLMMNLIGKLEDKSYKNIHSMLLVKNGKLVVEEYFPGQTGDGFDQDSKRDTLHSQQSVTKSVNSLLVGIAIDQHLLRGVDEKISALLPDHADLFADGSKDAICLRDCLSMTAGLSWDESSFPYTDRRNDHNGLNRSKDPVRHVLARPVAAVPGEKFTYNSGISIMLGEIIRRASGLTADEFAQRHLFAPLGIVDYRWAKLPNGSVQTGGGLFLRPRDMAKIGYLVLE